MNASDTTTIGSLLDQWVLLPKSTEQANRDRQRNQHLMRPTSEFGVDDTSTIRSHIDMKHLMRPTSVFEVDDTTDNCSHISITPAEDHLPHLTRQSLSAALYDNISTTSNNRQNNEGNKNTTKNILNSFVNDTTNQLQPSTKIVFSFSSIPIYRETNQLQDTWSGPSWPGSRGEDNFTNMTRSQAYNILNSENTTVESNQTFPEHFPNSSDERKHLNEIYSSVSQTSQKFRHVFHPIEDELTSTIWRVISNHRTDLLADHSSVVWVVRYSTTAGVQLLALLEFALMVQLLPRRTVLVLHLLVAAGLTVVLVTAKMLWQGKFASKRRVKIIYL